MDAAGGSRKAGTGLVSCAGCHGVFPGTKLETVGGKVLCVECRKKFGPLQAEGASAPQSVSKFIPSSSARAPAPPLAAQTHDEFGPVRTQPAAEAPAPAPNDDNPYSAAFAASSAGQKHRMGAPAYDEPSTLAAPPDADAKRWTMVARGRGNFEEAGSVGGKTDAGSGGSVPAPPRMTRGLPEFAPKAGPPAAEAPAPAPSPAQGSAAVIGSRMSKFGSFSQTAPEAGGAHRANSIGTPAAPPAPVASPASEPKRPTFAAPGVGGGPAVVIDDEEKADDGRMKGGPRDGFGEYAELRKKIDEGDDTLETRRKAAETASRLGLNLEAAEHYKRCVELAPGDDKLRIRWENVRRAAGVDRGGAPETFAQPERKVAEESAPFWTDLGDAFGYPLRGQGIPVILVGGACLGLGQVLGAINTFGFVVSVMIAGYCSSYLFDVINSTGAGKTAPPEMPEAANFIETYVFPLLSIVACVFVSYAPFMVSIWLATRGWMPGPIGGTLLLVTFVWGTFAMPMTLLVRAMFQSWSEPLNPSLVFGSIMRILPDYIAVYVAFTLLWIGYGVVSGVLYFAFLVTLGEPSVNAVLSFDGLRMVSWILFTICSWPLFLYTWMLQGHLLGRLYRQGLRRLAWFVPATGQTHTAKRMSAALGAGAIAATGLLCLAAWGVSKAMTLTSGSPNASALFAKCPLKPGSRLTYFWEDTDGAAGLTTYAFEAAPDGKLRVTGTVRLANQPECCGPSDDLGIMDPANGTFLSVGGAWGTGIHFDGIRRGEHVAFYGPKTTGIGNTFVNEWPVRSSGKWQNVWDAWKVTQADPQRASADLYFDKRTGVLVGRFFGGVGHQMTEWLVAARNVQVTPGPPPSFDFGPMPLDWTGDTKKDEGRLPPVDGIDDMLRQAAEDE